MVCYVAATLVFNVVVTHHLVGNTDARLADRLQDARQQTLSLPQEGEAPASDDADLDDAPAFLWSVAPTRAVTTLTPGAPTLPTRVWGAEPVTLDLGSSTFRFDTLPVGNDVFVAGQSLAAVENVQSTLLVAELVFGGILAVAVFAGATIVGLRASAPSELVRRRQAEFTADASHELRTPISVIEAEVDLALDRPREPAAYREVLERVRHESHRLRRIVEDLLWLARADDRPRPEDREELADLAQVAAACVQRFGALATTREQSLTLYQAGDAPFTVHAPPAWVDRLTGVLVDNACKFAGPGGRVEVSVRASGNRVGLRVDDTGPGIPPEEREAVFDRFHRATDAAGGTGLGLAIADSVVRATEGSWEIGGADLGGARMEVWWRRAAARKAKAEPWWEQGPPRTDLRDATPTP